MSEPEKPIAIYIDADACPVKAETFRVAERYALKEKAGFDDLHLDLADERRASLESNALTTQIFVE